MKNLQTIITILALAFTVFSCETNDEIFNMKQSQINNTNAIGGNLGLSDSNGQIVTAIVVTFKTGVSESQKTALRNHYTSTFNLLSWNTHPTDPNIQIWIVDTPYNNEFIVNIYEVGEEEAVKHTEYTVN